MSRRIYGANPHTDLLKELKIDCARCGGLCCTALYFFKVDGFPADKPAGTPCTNLLPDSRCAIHQQLSQRGLHGCVAFDCQGAGPRVTRSLYAGIDLSTSSQTSQTSREICEVFFRVLRIHQILWYLATAASLAPAKALVPQIEALLHENYQRLCLSPAEILALDSAACQAPVNALLKKVIAAVQDYVLSESSCEHPNPANSTRVRRPPTDCVGKRFSGSNFTAADFSMSLLVAADLSGCCLRGSSLLGADLRGTKLLGADLSESIFLTQAQLNGAVGDSETKLPPFLTPPQSWTT